MLDNFNCFILFIAEKSESVKPAYTQVIPKDKRSTSVPTMYVVEDVPCIYSEANPVILSPDPPAALYSEATPVKPAYLSTDVLIQPTHVNQLYPSLSSLYCKVCWMISLFHWNFLFFHISLFTTATDFAVLLKFGCFCFKFFFQFLISLLVSIIRTHANLHHSHLCKSQSSKHFSPPSSKQMLVFSRIHTSWDFNQNFIQNWLFLGKTSSRFRLGLGLWSLGRGFSEDKNEPGHYIRRNWNERCVSCVVQGNAGWNTEAPGWILCRVVPWNNQSRVRTLSTLIENWIFIAETSTVNERVVINYCLLS